MKIRKFFLSMFLLVSFFVSSLLGSVFLNKAIAQGDDKVGINVDDMVLVATVNIYNAQIVKQVNNDIKLSFDLSNRELVQPDVRYSVALIREGENGSQTLIDEKVYPEVVNLAENQTIKKEIKYVAPKYLSGEFQLFIYAKNKNGLTLALANLDTVSLSGDEQYVEIINDTCYLKIGDDNTSQYSIFQGVDMKNDEELTVICDVVNRFGNSIEFSPTIKTVHRTSFGQGVETENSSEIKYSLEANEMKQLAFKVTKPSVPQAYDAQLKFVNQGGEIISNKVNIHYVIKGLSATIQNVRLNKNDYKKEEVAKVSFFWSGPADNFLGSRLEPTKGEKMFAEIILTDSQGRDCADKFRSELNGNDTTPEFDLAIKKSCNNPKVLVNIQDENGNILDERQFNLKNGFFSEVSNDEKFLLFGFIILGLLLLLSWIVIFSKKKGKRRVSVIFFLMILSGLFLSGGVSQADTFSGSYKMSPQFVTSWYHTHEYTITGSLNKLNYFPNERITGSLAINSVSCMNSLMDESLTINLKNAHSNTKTGGINTSAGVFYSHSTYTEAPTVVGAYNALFSFRDNRCFANFGDCQRAVDNNGATYFNNELYASNKTSHLNSIKYNGKDNWTEAQTKNLCISMSGSLYNHYVQFGKNEGVSSCKANCNFSEENLENAAKKWPMAYNVIPGSTLVNGACGTRNTIYASNVINWPAGSTLCSKGSAVPANVVFPQPNSSVNWQCVGSGGGTTANCSANHQALGTPIPTLEIMANPTTVNYGESTNVSWFTTNATSCRSSGSWGSASQGTIGMRTMYSLTSNRTYSMECFNEGGATTGVKSVVVQVIPLRVQGVCGTRSKTYLPNESDWPVGTTFCQSGTPSPSTLIFPAAGMSVNWQCSGSGGGLPQSCSAVRGLEDPQIQISLPAESEITLNGDNPKVVDTKRVTLTWNITNSGNACSCGSGCSCDLTVDSEEFKDIPYESKNTHDVYLGPGTHSIKVVCVNQTPASITAESVISTKCNPTEWNSGCEASCGEANVYKNNIDAACAKTEAVVGECNLPDCPISMEFKEADL